MSTAWRFQGWATEALREATVGTVVDVVVSVALTIVLAYLAHHHIIKPAIERHKQREAEAERRHQEVMAMHRKTHEHLGIDPDA